MINVGGSTIDNLNFYFRTPELPVVGFQTPASSVSEGARQALIPIAVTRLGGTRLVMTVKVGSGGTAISVGSDHYFFKQTFAFPAIEVNNPSGNKILQTFNLQVPIIHDSINESNETIELELSPEQVTYAMSNAKHTVTIIDNEPSEVMFKDGFEATLPLRQ